MQNCSTFRDRINSLIVEFEEHKKKEAQDKTRLTVLGRKRSIEDVGVPGMRHDLTNITHMVLPEAKDLRKKRLGMKQHSNKKCRL